MRKKLIEVALPLEAINQASAREKSIRHGHPSTLHLWWARRPLAAARAVIFSSLVDDPDSPDALPAFVEACKELPKGANAAIEDTPRMRLFDFIERLVTWEATTDEAILNTARELIRIATEGNRPPLLDPFAGGGSIPLEAQRLGLEAHASDLNPVAVMINKAQIEIPPRFANMPPVNPRDRARMNSAEGWKGAAGLAADVRYYGEWMRERAWERIGHLYPTHNGETVIAWLWARTVKSPNPAVDVYVPLVRSFELSKKSGKRIWVEPQIDNQMKHVSFAVRREQDGDDPRTIPEGTVNRRGGRDIVTGVPIPFDYIRAEGKASRMNAQLMAIVTDGKNGRNFHSPNEHQIRVSAEAKPDWTPDYPLPANPRDFKTPNYGLSTFASLFTARQIVALNALSDLVGEAREQARQDALAVALAEDANQLRDDGNNARIYADAITLYLSFGVSKLSDQFNALCRWKESKTQVVGLFSRQAIPMVWDFAENNGFADAAGDYGVTVNTIAKALERLPLHPNAGQADQSDVMQLQVAYTALVSTDPPYYDNVGYADLSDFFYVWMRRSLRDVYPENFATLLVPKTQELVATPYRFNGNKDAANAYFEQGLFSAFNVMRNTEDAKYPLTVYYAFKQQEGEDDDDNDVQEIKLGHTRASSGWETLLTGLVKSGFVIRGTWPIRTELANRMIGMGTNALASSIVLVCRPRPEDAPTISRRQFVDALRRELPAALEDMQSGNIAPVDLAQASIGPGMAIYSRYSKVLEADGTPMSVRTALGLINQELDAYLAEQDGDIDADTRFAIDWFTQYGFNEGEFGQADVLARAKNTSVAGVAEAGVVDAARGRVKLRHWHDYDPGAWKPQSDKRPTVWEATHHLIERLNSHGETGSAALMTQMPPDMAAEARQLAYRLYSICERKGWADHARDYNALVISWAGIGEEAARLREASQPGETGEQIGLGGEFE